MGCVVKAFSGFEHPPILKRTKIQCSKYGNFLDLQPEHHPSPLTGFDLPPAKTRGGHDLVVIGAGPAGLRLAEQASVRGMQVCVVDPKPLSGWANNYGCWVDEVSPLGLSHCLDHTWPGASVVLDHRPIRLPRPYGRLDRTKLKSHLLEGCLRSGLVSFHEGTAVGVVHGESGSWVACEEGVAVGGRLVADASGFGSRFVEYGRRRGHAAGFQVAHGVLAEVESHPFDLDEMLLMDWRDSHLDSEPRAREANRRRPTFLYAMPLGPTLVFLEETSLVGRPALAYEDVKARMAARLRHLGIRVLRVLEQEKCVIPMGGPLPRVPQTALALGGAAAMVHPATGYMVARTLEQAGAVAQAAVEHGTPRRVWEEALWPPERRAAREFYAFGMETLLQLDLEGTRSFFAAFFELEPRLWHAFLSSSLSPQDLASFSLSLFARASPSSKLHILSKCPLPLANMFANLALDHFHYH